MIKINSKLLNCLIVVFEKGEVAKDIDGFVRYTEDEVNELREKSKEDVIKYHKDKIAEEFGNKLNLVLKIFDGIIIESPPTAAPTIDKKKEGKDVSLF